MFSGEHRVNYCFNFGRITRFINIISVVIFVVISICILVPYFQEEENVSAVADPTIPSAITFTELNNAATVTIIPSLAGTFATTSGDGDIRFNVSTTNYTGYTLTARATKTTLDNGTNTIPTLASAVTAVQFASSGNTPLSNRWGYKPNYINSASNSNYLPSPTSSGTVLDVTSAANSTAKSYSFSLGARIDLSLPYGSYVNTVFSLEVTANPVPYRIIFNGNGGDDTVSNLPSTMNGEAVTATAISLPNTSPTRQNHSFAGWCTVMPTRGTGGNETCSGTTYAAGDIYAIDYTGNNMGIVLYAIWTLNITCNTSAITIAANNSVTDAVCIQDMNDTIAGTMNVGTNYRLIDVRDGTYYYLAKLLDGRVWMTDNLDLGRTTLATDLTISNTNLSTTVTASTFNNWKKTTGSATYDAGEFIPLTTSNTSNGLDTDPTSTTTYGTLYNYYAASAGTISGSSNSNNASYDICPAGWRLPTGGSSGEFQALYAEYNSNALMRASIENSGAAFALAGYFNDAASAGQGSSGVYWSSTRYDGTGMYDLGLFTSNVVPANIDRRHIGSAIRCVLKKPTHTLTVSYGTGVSSVTINGQTVTDGGTIDLEQGVNYAIDMTATSNYAFSSWSATSGTVGSTTTKSTTYAIAASNATLTANASFNGTYIQNLDSSACTSTASTVYDSRDMHTYTIQRLNDGNCWMMENLDLGRTTLTTDLTSSNTNLSTTVTASAFNGWKKTTSSGTYTAGEFISIDGADSTSGTAYGTLYNFYAASAGTITGSTNSGNASYDICPAGWRLPTGGTYGEEHALYAQYNSSALIRASIENGGAAFALAGYFSSGSPVDQGVEGDYWSSSWNGTNTNVHHLFVDSSKIRMEGSYYRSAGFSIRCILKPKTISDLIYLQDFKDLSNNDLMSVLDSMTDSTTYNLIDNRDNRTYKIAKMKDGKIWMAENLDLGRTALTTDLTSANTNLSTTITASLFNSWKKTSGSQTYTSGEFINVSGTDSTSGTQYGTLYNYYAASAGTITGSTNSDNASYDICPAGWRLPTGGATGEFQALYEQYNSNALMRATIANGGAAFPLAGYFGSTTVGLGTEGNYWSSIRSNDTNMHHMYVATSSVSASTFYYRNYGFSIRCVLKTKTILEITRMQTFSTLPVADKATVAASMVEGSTYRLTDYRNDYLGTYKVSKLKDGKIWMMENLAIGRTTLTADLTSSNTNLATTVPAATFNGWKKTSGTATYDAGEFIAVSGIDSTSGTDYGILYNYYAASAGTISGSSNSNNASYDICPAGWRLPIGGFTGEFQALYEQYNSADLMRASTDNLGAAFALAGYFYDVTEAQGSYGRYWSSTRYNDTFMYGLYISASTVTPANGNRRNNGYAIRCVVK